MAKKSVLKPLPSSYAVHERAQKLVVLPNELYTPSEYFQNLIDQMKDDIFPLFRKTNGGAPFTVTRNTFCYIDHIAQLVYGPDGAQTPRMKKVVSELGRVDAKINENYKSYAQYLIQIYRHDLVHNIRPFPKQIRVKSAHKTEDKETWFFMVTNCDGKGFDESLKEMSKKKSRSGRAHLRLAGDQVNVDTFSLFFDTIILIDECKNRAASEPTFNKTVVKNYYKIMNKHYYSIEKFTLDQTSNKQIA